MLAKNGTHDDNDDDATPLFSKPCLLSPNLRFLRVLLFHCLCRIKEKNKKKESRYDRENYPRIGQGCLDLRCSIVTPLSLMAILVKPSFFCYFWRMVGFEGSAGDYCDLLHELKEHDRLLLLQLQLTPSLGPNDTFDLKRRRNVFLLTQ